MFPSASISMCSAAGVAGNPGIRIISPVMGTKKPAPLATSISLTVSVKPDGLPIKSGSSLNDFWVLAIQIGKPSNPSALTLLRSCLALARKSTLPAP